MHLHLLVCLRTVPIVVISKLSNELLVGLLALCHFLADYKDFISLQVLEGADTIFKGTDVCTGTVETGEALLIEKSHSGELMGHLGVLGFVVRFLFFQQLIFNPQCLNLVF